MKVLPRISARYLGTVFVLAAVYMIAAKLGLRLAFVHASATAVWPPTGIALAALLLLGYDVWPAIFIGAFTANILTAGSVATSLGIGAGNTLEALVGAYLVNRYAGGRDVFQKPENVFRFAAYAALFATIVSPTIGIGSLLLGGYAEWSRAGAIWITWWLGDAVGALVWAPPLLLWSTWPRGWWPWRRIAEITGVFAAVLITTAFVFGGIFPSPVKDYPLEFLCIPPLLWAAFRFGPREASTATLLHSKLAILGTVASFGPFVRETQNESLLLLQSYVFVASLTMLTLSTVVKERRLLEHKLRELSVTDPLTGLANYRLLVDRLIAEMVRSQRTGRPFALLLLDVDGLKRINDKFGHLTGSRALSRVGDALRAASRSMDTPARYGGDEFAVILPETDTAMAQRIAERIEESLARDGQTPPVTVSIGVSMYPEHGETTEALLGAADETLYAVKARAKQLESREA